MKSEIKKARKALQGIHREYLLWAMDQRDKEYIEAMNAIFKLLDRLEEEDAA
tara:strand:- start:3801 stop:3956 length:156 start_codon:yes stop_codon:yes gene_type:complete